MPIAMPMRLLLLAVALHLCSHHSPASSAARSSTDTAALFPGQSLAAGDKLVSGNGKFALGFFHLAGAAGSKSSRDTSESHWHLGIWFDKIPKCTPVWVANRERPLTDPSSSVLTFSEDGTLVLFNRATNSTVWSIEANVTTTNATVLVLVLLDTGNLVLRGSANASDALWQSFDHPTDTLLPDAAIGLDKVTGRARRLVSRKNMLDQSSGVYSMELGLAGAVQLLWNSSVPYWSSGDWSEEYRHFSSVPGMTVRHLFDFTFVDDRREVSFAYHLRDETATVYSFLDVSGQRKVLLWQESAQDWLPIYNHPEFQCDAHAACGQFAACSENAAASPCTCLKGFSVAAPDDWEQGDRTAGCRRDTPLDCGGDRRGVAGSTDRFYGVAAVRTPYDPQSAGGLVASASECEQACLSNCSCSAYSFGNGGCSVWHGELLNVKHLHFADTTAGDNGEVLYLRLAAEEFQTRKKNRGLIIGGAIGTGIATLSVLVLVLLMMARRNRRISNTLNRSLHGDSGLIAFRYRDLQRATKDFSDKIGAGGFGSVFKGSLNKSTAIAVKRLNGSYGAEKQFRTEVSSLGILQHTNLVRMLGFCCEGDRRLLVYEHMPNLSLDVHLFRRDGAAAAVLSWSARYRIAVGAARGLAYLHESCRDRVIHCDVKPQNILLDAALAPRIADFGMAKLVARDLSRVLTTARGTVGYLAPEWIGGMPVTAKVDVYAYGMVLLEIVSGRMNSEEDGTCSGEDNDDDDVVYFPVLVARKLLEWDVMSLVDSRLGGDAVAEEVERACKVACWCIQDSEADRPAMGKVVQILEGLVEVDMPPTPRLLVAIAGRSHSACT